MQVLQKIGETLNIFSTLGNIGNSEHFRPPNQEDSGKQGIKTNAFAPFLEKELKVFLFLRVKYITSTYQTYTLGGLTV